MPPKRPPPPAEGLPQSKTPKTEQKSQDFSTSVKKRLQSSARTGQACDRCKVRKIRCDALPGGCSPCLLNQTQCQTTDRITGRAAPRGYAEGLESHNRHLIDHIRELENTLMQNGIEFKPADNKGLGDFSDSNAQNYNCAPSAPGEDPISGWHGSRSEDNPATLSKSNTASYGQAPHIFRPLPLFRTQRPGDNYLGVSSGNSHVSSIKGTQLSLLGIEIDIADFESEDLDEPSPAVLHQPLYNKSYQAFLQTALNMNPNAPKPELPPRDEGLTYADWYFKIINPYLPLLHKNTFMNTLHCMYDDPTFHPTAAQTVIVHMIFAIMFFQYAVRNLENAEQRLTLNNLSNSHYHYSLSLFYQLSCSHTVQDVQALTLLCYHVRNFPKPGASWILTMTTMSYALELGLHRSVKTWPLEQSPNPLETEMRKRIFYSIMAIHVTLSGKLGRPMLLRPEDYDVEMPEPLDDDCLTEAGLDTSRPGVCAHKVGISVFQLVPLFMEMYSRIYAVRTSPESYIDTINEFEAKIRSWQENLPKEIIQDEAQGNDLAGRIFVLYTQIWVCEFRLLLRHPSVWLTTDSKFNEESMRVCVEMSDVMLQIVTQLKDLKSLDTTWYSSAVYVMSITVRLFAQWQQQGDLSAEAYSKLRADMDLWLDVMAEVGAILGSGIRLRVAVSRAIENTMKPLSRRIKNPANAINPKDSSKKSPQRRAPSIGKATGSPTYSESFSESAGHSTSGTGVTSNYPREPQVSHQQTPYPAATQYSDYPDPSTVASAGLGYSSGDQHGYNNYSSNNDNIEAPLLHAFAVQAAAVSGEDWGPKPESYPMHSGPQAWQEWTNTMSGGNLEPRDRYSADALMQLGGRDLNIQSDAGNGAAPISDMNAATMLQGHQSDGGNIGGGSVANQGMTWPLNIFDIGPGGNA